MANERDRYGRYRGRDDEDWGRRMQGRGDYGRFREDEDGGGRGRSMWGGSSSDYRGGGDRYRARDEDLPSVGSPGVGGGTGGYWDQRPWDRDRGGDEMRYGRGGGGAGRERGYGREPEWRGRGDDARYFGDEERQGRNRSGMSTSAGWGREMGGREEEAGYGGNEDWSPPQSGMERTGRGWGGGVARNLGGNLGMGRESYGGRGPGGTERMSERMGERRGGFAGRGPMNYQRSDQRIHEDVCDCLTDHDEVDASNIDVKVEKCEVTLTGTVPSREMKRRAEEAIERVSGVKDVHNQLKVRSEREGSSERETQGRNGTTAQGGNDRAGKQTHPS